MRRQFVMLASSLVACSPRASDSASEEQGRSQTSPATTGEAVPLPGVREHALPDALGGSSPQLSVGSEGVSLVWMSGGAAPSVKLASVQPGGEWSEVEIVTTSPSLLINWADVPAIGETASGRTVVAWPEFHAADPAQGYGLRVAAARDDGSFAPAWSPDDVRRGPESGFASFVSTPTELRLVWLDGRDLGGGGGGGGTMQLRSVAIDDEGNQVGPSIVLDDRTCECCKLDAGLLGEQVFAAYRDRSEAEVRDVFVAGPALPPTRVAADEWTIAGCPVNGPAVAVAVGRAHVAWFTGVHEQGASFIARSDTLARFDPPQRFDLGATGGRVDLIALPDGDVLISWLELDTERAGHAQLLTRRFDRNGVLGQPYTVAELGAARDWGFPRAAALGDEVLWVFTDPSAADGRPRLSARVGTVPAN